MEQLTFMKKCEHKNRTQEPIADENTGEVLRMRVTCSDCGRFIKWERIIDNQYFLMPYGKHKGKTLPWIKANDLEYFMWLIGNTSRNIAKRMEEILCQA